MRGCEMGQLMHICPCAEKPSSTGHDHDSDVLVLLQLIQNVLQLLEYGEIEDVGRRIMQRNPRDMAGDRQQLVRHRLLHTALRVVRRLTGRSPSSLPPAERHLSHSCSLPSAYEPSPNHGQIPATADARQSTRQAPEYLHRSSRRSCARSDTSLADLAGWNPLRQDLLC